MSVILKCDRCDLKHDDMVTATQAGCPVPVELPNGWLEVDEAHLCPVCATAFRLFMHEKTEVEA